MLTLLADKAARQSTLFDDPVVRARSAKLMADVDAVNLQIGRGTLRSGASGKEQHWVMRSESRSPRFTTRFDELPVAR